MEREKLKVDTTDSVTLDTHKYLQSINIKYANKVRFRTFFFFEKNGNISKIVNFKNVCSI